MSRLLLPVLLLAALSLAFPVSAAPTGLLTLNLSQVWNNQSEAFVQILSLKYPPEGVEAGRELDLVGLTAVPLTGVACSGPSECRCKVSGDKEFFCAVVPPASGTYRLSLRASGASGTYELALAPGSPVRITELKAEETAPSDALSWALALLLLVALLAALRFGYAALTEEKRGVAKSAAQEAALEEKLRTLKVRYLKREIDDATYADLARKTEDELRAVRENRLR